MFLLYTKLILIESRNGKNMKSFTITKMDDGQRLNRFLEKTVPLLSGSMMYKSLRTKRIKVNGKRAEASTRLSEGDLVELYLSDEMFDKSKKQPDFMRASKQITILYEDNNIILMNKPAGLLVHDDSNTSSDTMINRLLRFLFERGDYVPNSEESFTPALCNRLDRGTEGIVIAAKNPDALREMNRIIKERLIKKHYLAAVVAKPPKNGKYTANLFKDEKHNTVFISTTPVPGSKTIVTAFSTLKEGDGLWLLDVDLITGRTHQIRAHLKHLGCPILGDGKYGDGHINRRYRVTRQALAAYRIRFDLSEHLSEFPTLAYLDKESFKLDSVWFEAEFFPPKRTAKR